MVISYEDISDILNRVFCDGFEISQHNGTFFIKTFSEKLDKFVSNIKCDSTELFGIWYLSITISDENVKFYIDEKFPFEYMCIFRDNFLELRKNEKLFNESLNNIMRLKSDDILQIVRDYKLDKLI